MITPKQTFNKLSPEGKQAVLNIEKKLKENYEEQRFLNRLLKNMAVFK
jgi:hypothetical protein